MRFACSRILATGHSDAPGSPSASNRPRTACPPLRELYTKFADALLTYLSPFAQSLTHGERRTAGLSAARMIFGMVRPASTRTGPPCALPPGTSIRSSSGSRTSAPGCRSAQPDIVCLQETKMPGRELSRASRSKRSGYNVAIHGQKTFNGVAILSKLAVRRGDAAPARRSGGRPRALHRGGGVDADAARCASRRSICPMATRRTLKNMTTKSNG